MKFKVLFLLTIVSMLSIQANAQRGVRIGYIDTEYILQNVPEYTEATSQLDSKVQKWKGEIEKQLKTIEQKRNDLNNEKALLTKELIEEREEDISFEEKEILDYLGWGVRISFSPYRNRLRTESTIRFTKNRYEVR